MKVDTDPLLMAETNYAEPLDVNMVEIAEKKVELENKFEEDGDFILIKNKTKATECLPKVLRAKILSDAMKATNGLLVANKKLTEATEGLRAKFEKVQITEGQTLRVHMVDLEQPNA